MKERKVTLRIGATDCVTLLIALHCWSKTLENSEDMTRFLEVRERIERALGAPAMETEREKENILQQLKMRAKVTRSTYLDACDAYQEACEEDARAEASGEEYTEESEAYIKNLLQEENQAGKEHEAAERALKAFQERYMN